MLPYGLLAELPEASTMPTGKDQPAVDIWWWAYAAGKTDWNKVRSTLSLPEQDRAATYRFERDVIGFMAGRYLQRSVLSSYLEGTAEHLNIVVGEYGKPSHVGDTTLAFNLSNTSELAVLAVSRDCSAVGVDAETQSTVLEAETAQIICSPAESAALSMLQGVEHQSLLLAYWTLKESFLKATGHGLTVEPHVLHVRVDADTRDIRIDHPLPGGGPNWHHRLFRSPVGHVIAASVRSDRPGLVFRQHSLPDPVF
jgi:4'-phosphopantetheinyl transferase